MPKNKKLSYYAIRNGHLKISSIEFGTMTTCVELKVTSLTVMQSGLGSKKMRKPGIEPGAHRWQRWILPLNHLRSEFVENFVKLNGMKGTASQVIFF